MNYFKDIEWIAYNHAPDCSAWVSKHFTYYVIQYAHSGELSLQIDDNEPMTLKGPVVWLTYPGPYFRFGRQDGGTWNHRFVAFRGKRADGYAKEGLFPAEAPAMEIVNNIRFARAFDELIDYLDSPLYGKDRAVQMLEGLLLQLQEQNIRITAGSPTAQ